MIRRVGANLLLKPISKMSLKRLFRSCVPINLRFKEPIEFLSLTILKRSNIQFGNRYNKVCLVLDEELDNKNCTNTNSGFDNQSSNLITWTLDSQGLFM